MSTRFEAAAAGVPELRLTFAYDSMSRRIQKKVDMKTAGQWEQRSDTRFVYDGWNLMAEIEYFGAAADAPKTTVENAGQVFIRRSFVLGTDVSGTMDGAGGVGGLLMMSRHDRGTQPAESFWVTMDLNGNVIGLVSTTNSERTAIYDYDPFGKPIRVSEPEAGLNPFRFSSKYTDVESGMLYYGYRYYSPELARWVNRDPMYEITGEHPEFMEEGPNLYGFVHNDPVNGYDFMGLKWRKVGKTKDKRRLIWERDDPAKDTFEELAKKVDLDPQEASSWAKPDEKNSCRFTTPNVWIMVKMLHGINSFRDIYTNPGDEIGDLFTFTGSRKTVNLSRSGAIVSTINQYRGDIIGLSIFGHGDIGIVGGTAYGDFEYVDNILGAVDGNGFKLKKAYLMQCYSGAGGYDAKWKARCYKGRAKVYYGMNACGIDFGKKPKPPLRQ